MSVIDANEAPKGYVAVDSNGTCHGCAFHGSDKCNDVICASFRRDDGCDVKFIKKENAVSKNSKFIVGSIMKGSGEFSISSYPHRHDSEEEAKQEATRLATSIPVKKFVVFEIKGIVSVGGVTWE